MFSDHEGFGYQLRLLNDFLLVGQPHQAMGRVHRTAFQLIGDVPIDLLRLKSRVLMFRMARLSANFALLTVAQRLGWRFDNVTGGPFG